MKKKLLVVALGLSSSITLIGCGGGDSDNSGQVTTPAVTTPAVTTPAVTTPPPVTTPPDPVVTTPPDPVVTTPPDPVVTPPPTPAPVPVIYNVKVIDGYLKNAQVWLDVNGNKQLDVNEPSTLSGDGGVAALDVSNIANPESYATYAKVIFGQTIDEDRGAVAKDYLMSAPAGETEITPLSTLIAIAIAQNTNGSETADQLAVIKQNMIEKVAYDFGIAESDVLDDYIASETGSATYVAENIVNSQILPDDSDEFIVVVADNSDDAAFNKQTAVVSGMIKDVVEITAEEDFDSQAAIFDSDDDLETDSDADGVPDLLDALPNDANEWLDSDGDLIGNNADPDDDNDGIDDNMDADPLDPEVGAYEECVVHYVASDASIDDFNAALDACEYIPEMDLAGNALIRLTNSLQPRAYVFNIDHTGSFYRNGVPYHRVWEINADGNVEIYNGDGQILHYVMRLIDNSTEDWVFAVHDNSKQSIWTTRYKDLDVSEAVLECEDLASGWDDVNNEPVTYRSYDDFKQALTSCQADKLVAVFSEGFIDQGITLTTSDALSPADDFDEYQFNQDGTGVLTYSADDGEIISTPMTWSMHEEGVVKVVFYYTDENDIAQETHDYISIVETNGIDFSVRIFTRATDFQGLGDDALGDLWGGVLKASDIE